MPERAAPVLAVDIGGTTTRVAVVEGLSLHSRREMPTQAHDGPERLLQRLGRLIAEVPLKNVTSRFAMERAKHSTALPLKIP